MVLCEGPDGGEIPHAVSGLEDREIDTSLYRDLLADLEFQNLVVYHLDLLTWATGDKKRLREKLSRILDLLEEEIGEVSQAAAPRSSGPGPCSPGSPSRQGCTWRRR